jgi:hypothetical protein
VSQEDVFSESVALQTATEYARAYPSGDFNRVRQLVTGDVLEREIDLGGCVGHGERLGTQPGGRAK